MILFFLLNVKLKQEMSKHSVRHFCYFITWSVIARGEEGAECVQLTVLHVATLTNCQSVTVPGFGIFWVT